MGQKEAVKLAKACLSLLDGASKGSGKSRKTLKKTKEAKGRTEVPDNPTQATFYVNLEKAKSAAKNAKGTMTAAASQMLVFYANQLSVKAKYLWNKIIKEQMEGDPYVDLQVVSQSGSRGMSRKLFDDCVLFHILTVFPINAAEQEKYYITNVLKKPQHVNIHQFVRQVEQLNAYIAQTPCFYYSPSINANTKPKNVLFTETEQGAHVLCMCPIQWQDQYNLNEKGMMPMDLHSLLTLLEAIEHVCTHKKAKSESFEKASHQGKKGKKHPGTKSMARVLKKVCYKKHCNLCKKHGGMYTLHNTRDCCRYEKDGKEKSNFCAAKKGGKKANPVNQNFRKLSKKLDKLEKALKKLSKKAQKRQYEDSDSDSK